MTTFIAAHKLMNMLVAAHYPWWGRRGQVTWPTSLVVHGVTWHRGHVDVVRVVTGTRDAPRHARRFVFCVLLCLCVCEWEKGEEIWKDNIYLPQTLCNIPTYSFETRKVMSNPVFSVFRDSPPYVPQTINKFKSKGYVKQVWRTGHKPVREKKCVMYTLGFFSVRLGAEKINGLGIHSHVFALVTGIHLSRDAQAHVKWGT